MVWLDYSNGLVSLMTIAKYLHGEVRRISSVRALVLVFSILALSVATAEARPYQLAWDRNTDGLTTGYRVYYGTAPGAYQPANGIDVGNAVEFTADLTPGSSYYFVVRAYSATSLGPPSAELRFTVPLDASVSVNTASVASGATITATVTTGPGNQTDWVGFFPSGASSNGWTDWKYLNGSRSTPATGVTSGTVSFVAPSTAGTYNVRFYSSTNVLLASSVSITVGGSPSVSALTSSVSAGQSFSVAVANGPARPTDWVALYPASSTNTSGYIDWKYLNGSQAAPATGVTNANVTFIAPAQAGQYIVRLLYSGGSSVLASSGVITVVAGGTVPSTVASVTPSFTTLAAGSSLIAQIRNGPAGRLDWVGLFPVGASNHVAWFYLNGSTTAPATGMSTANVTFTAPQQAGQYTLRFFASNNTTTPMATSTAITVTTASTTPPPSRAPTVTPSVTSVVPGGNVTAQVRNGPAGRYDWVGLFPAGAGQTGFVDWFYLNGSKVAPSSGTSSANVVFTMPAGGGKHVMVLFANNGYTALSTSANIMVETNTVTTNPSITPSATTVARGSLLTVTVANGTGSPYDWIGIYTAADVGAGWINWMYLNGTLVPPLTGSRSATFTVKMPSTPGTYILRFYANGSSSSTAWLANSVNIIVQ